MSVQENENTPLENSENEKKEQIEQNNQVEQNKEELIVQSGPEKEELADEKSEEFVLGIDFGATKTVVSIAKIGEPKHFPFVLHNTIGELYHSNVISYGKAERIFGVNAASQLIVNPRTTIYNVKQYLARSASDFESLRSETRFACDSSSSPILIPIPSPFSEEGDDVALRVEQIAASLLKRYISYAESDLLYWQFRKKIIDRERRKRGLESSGETVKGLKITKVVLSIPDSFSSAQSAALIDAAQIAGLDVINVISDSLATSFAFALSNNANFKEEEVKIKEEKVIIIDVGHTHLHGSISRVSLNSLQPIAQHVSEDCSGSHFEKFTHQFVEAEIRKKYKVSDPFSARSQAKLSRAIQKAITVLSTIPQTIIEVDSLTPDLNIQFELSRTQFEAICAPAFAAFDSFLNRLFASDPSLSFDDPSLRIELLGGSSRVPALQERIKNATNGKELSRSLDSNASTSVGAALFGALFQSSSDESPDRYIINDLDQIISKGKSLLESSDRLGADDLKKYIEFEEKLCDRDELEKRFQDLKNEFEQFIYSHRDYSQQALSQSKISKEESEISLKLLADEETWLFDVVDITFDALHSRYQSFQANFAAAAPQLHQYVADLLAEKLRLEKEAAEAEANREVHYRDKVANPITPKERLDAALKRKDQGNECFRDINYEHAIQRYKQALVLLMEIPGDKFDEEIKQTKLTCYLNLAMCYLNLKKYSFAVDNCESALEIDNKNVKAYFRMGKANYNLKKFEDAKKNFSDLLNIEPDNKDAIKHLSLTEKAIRIQQEKEKKMYANMFS